MGWKYLQCTQFAWTDFHHQGLHRLLVVQHQVSQHTITRLIPPGIQLLQSLFLTLTNFSYHVYVWISYVSLSEVKEYIIDSGWCGGSLQVAEADVHQGRVEATLVLQYVRDAAHIFVNGLLEGWHKNCALISLSILFWKSWADTHEFCTMLGSVTGHGTQINQTVTLMAGTNDIVFLSMTTGLQVCERCS